MHSGSRPCYQHCEAFRFFGFATKGLGKTVRYYDTRDANERTTNKVSDLSQHFKMMIPPCHCTTLDSRYAALY